MAVVTPGCKEERESGALAVSDSPWAGEVAGSAVAVF